MNPYDVPRKIEELIDPMTGEVLDVEALQQLQMERDKLVEWLACSYKNHNLLAAGIAGEIENLQDRKRIEEKAADRAKQALDFLLNGERFESSKCKIGYRKSEKVMVLDKPAAAAFLKAQGYGYCVKEEPEVNLTEIKKLLREGVPVPSAAIVTRMNMGVK